MAKSPNTGVHTSSSMGGRVTVKDAAAAAAKAFRDKPESPAQYQASKDAQVSAAVTAAPALGPMDLLLNQTGSAMRDFIGGGLDAARLAATRYLGVTAALTPTMVANGEVTPDMLAEAEAWNWAPGISYPQAIAQIQQAATYAPTIPVIPTQSGFDVVVAPPQPQVIGGGRGETLPNVDPVPVRADPRIDVKPYAGPRLKDDVDEFAQYAAISGARPRYQDLDRWREAAINPPRQGVAVDDKVTYNLSVNAGVISMAVARTPRVSPRETKKRDTKGKGTGAWQRGMAFISATFGQATEIADTFWVMSWNIYVNVDGRAVPAMLAVTDDDFGKKLVTIYKMLLEGTAALDLAGVVVDMVDMQIEDFAIGQAGKGRQDMMNAIGFQGEIGIEARENMAFRALPDVTINDKEYSHGLQSPQLPTLRSSFDQSRASRADALVRGLPSFRS